MAVFDHGNDHEKNNNNKKIIIKIYFIYKASLQLKKALKWNQFIQKKVNFLKINNYPLEYNRVESLQINISSILVIY